MDGALSLFTPFGKSMFDPSPARPENPSDKNVAKSLVGLEPVPGLSALLLEVTREVAKEQASNGLLPPAGGEGASKTPEVVPLDAGLLCQQSAVRTVVKAVHQGMMKLVEVPKPT